MPDSKRRSAVRASDDCWRMAVDASGRPFHDTGECAETHEEYRAGGDQLDGGEAETTGEVGQGDQREDEPRRAR